MRKHPILLMIALLSYNVAYAVNCGDAEDYTGGGCKIASNTGGSIFEISGDIETDNTTNAHGLLISVNNDNTTTVNGDITTLGGISFGVFLSSADNNTTTVNGNITTSGEAAYGILLNSADDNITTINGNITTSGNSGHGVYLYNSDDNTTTVSGNITTSLASAFGVYLSSADGNTTTVNGNIITSSYGVFLYSSNDNTTTVNGNITTSGLSAHGVILDGSSGNVSNQNTVTINGNITTSAGDGVYLSSSEKNTINISGALSATGSGSKAVNMTSNTNTNTVNFGRGTKIIGPLKNDGADTNTLHFDMGVASSYMLDTDGTTWNLEDSSKPVVKGSANSRSAADMEDTNNRLYQRFNQLGRVTSLQHKRAVGNHVRGIWLDGYINDYERTITAKEMATESKGFTLGYRMWENWDVVANVETTETGYGLAEHTVESQSILAGVYNPNFMEMMQGSLAVKAFVGMSDGEGKLTVLNNAQSGTGSETVTEDYDSVYLVAGTEWFKSFNQDSKLYHDVYIGMDLIHERMSSHKASLYFTLDDRNVTQMNSSLKYGLGYRSESSKLHVGAIGQVAYTKILSGETQDYTITTTGGTATTTKFTGTEDSTYYEGSLGVGYDVSDATSVNINVQIFNSSEDIEGISGAANIRMVL